VLVKVLYFVNKCKGSTTVTSRNYKVFRNFPSSGKRVINEKKPIMQAAGGLQTLHGLYKTGFVPSPVPVMTWHPLMDDEVEYTNATAAPQIHLPPFGEAFKNPADKLYDVNAGYEKSEPKQSLLSKLFDRKDAKKKVGHGDPGHHGPFGKVNRGGEEIWLESYSFPGAKSGHHKRKRRLDNAKRRSDLGHSSSSGGSNLKNKIKSFAKGKGLFKEDRKGETIWLESSSNLVGGSSGGGKPHKKKGYGGLSSSSSSGGYWGKPDGKGGCYCSIGRSEKGDDAALITLGSIGIPLAIAGSILGGALGSGALAAIINATLGGIAGIFGGRGFEGRDFDTGMFDTSFYMGSLDNVLEHPLNNVLRFIDSPLVKFMRNPVENFKNNLGGISRSLEDGASVLLWKFATRGFGSSRNCFEQARGELMYHEDATMCKN
jgi:hypothetical protein